MVEEVEIDLKNARAVWDRGSRQPTGRDVEGHLPPVAHHRRQRKPDFTDDLRPHMKSGVSISPRLQGQTGPHVRVRRKSQCLLRSHADALLRRGAGYDSGLAGESELPHFRL